MEYLEFIFSGFWVFLGTTILITAFFNGIAVVIQALRK